MAKKLNKNMVVGLTFVAFVLTTAAGVWLVVLAQVKDPAAYVKNAEEAIAKQDWEAAQRYFHRAYSVSNDAGYLVRAGQMAYEIGDITRAMGMWHEAKVQDPQQIEARQKLLDLLLEVGRVQWVGPPHWVRVREEADGLLAVQPAHQQAKYARGLALARLKNDAPENLDQGIQILQEVRDASPQTTDYATTLAQLYVEKAAEIASASKGESVQLARAVQEIGKSEKIYRDLVAQHTDTGQDASETRCELGRFLDENATLLEYWKREEATQSRLREEALQVLQEAVTLAGDDPKALAKAKLELGLGWARRWSRERSLKTDAAAAPDLFDNAKTLIEESIKLQPDGLESYRSLAELYAERGMFEEAVKVCQARLDRPIQRDGLYAEKEKYLRYMLLLQACDTAIELASPLPRHDPRRAEILAQAQRFIDDAEAEYRGVPLGLHLAGRVKLANDQELEAMRFFSEAETLLQGVSPSTPQYAKVRVLNSYWLAQLQMRHDRLAAALDTAERGVQLAPQNPGLWITLAQARLRLGEYDRALQAGEQARALLPESAEALDVLIKANQQLGRTEKVAELVAQRPGDAQQNAMRRAELLQLEGQSREALAVLLAALEQAPADPDLVRGVAYLHMQLNESTKAYEVVQKALKIDPENLRLKSFALATDPSLSPEERENRQIGLLEQIEDPFTRSLRKAVWYLGKNKDAETLKELDVAERLILDKGSADAMTAGARYIGPILDTKFILAGKAKSWGIIEAAIKTAQDMNVDGAEGKSYVGLKHMFLATENKGESPEEKSKRKEQWEQAIEALKQAREFQPNDARNLTRLGQCYFALDRFVEARDALESAVTSNPKSADARKTLAALSARTGDSAAYERHLAVCEQLIPNDAWVKEALRAQKEFHNPEEAIPRREALRNEKPDDLGNLLKLADLYARAGKNDQAAECYEAALTLKPGDRGVAQVASAYYRKVDNNDRALAILEGLVAAQTDPTLKAENQLLVGQHHDLTGNISAGDEAFAAAEKIAPALRVRMGLAFHYYNTGRFEEALKWQELAVKMADEKEPTQGPALRRMAVDCCLKLNEKDKAGAVVVNYQERYPDDPSGWLMLSEVEFSRGHIDEAIAAVDRYLQARPKDPQALVQRAEYQLSQGKWPAAIRDLEQIRADDPKAFNFAPRMRLAEAYDLNGQPELAEGELQAILKENPDAVEVARKLVEFYFKRGRNTEAHSTLTGLINSFPENAEWYALRVKASAAVNNRPLALSDGRKSVELSGYRTQFVNALLDLFLEYKMGQEGLSFYIESVPEDKRHATSRFRFAGLLAVQGRQEESVNEYRQVMNNPSDLGLNDVRRLFQDIVRTFPGSTETDIFTSTPVTEELKRGNDLILSGLFNAHSRSAESIGKIEGLLQDATAGPERLLLLSLLGDAYAAQSRYEDARRCYEEGAKLDENSWSSLNNLAFLLAEHLNKPAEALAPAKRATLIVTRLGTLGSISPGERATVLDTYGWVLARLGQYDDAIGELSRGIQAEPLVIANYYHMGEVRRMKGDFENARLVIEQALLLLDSRGVPPEDAERKQLQESLQKVRNLDKA